jgi:hypothetical protein
MQDKVITYIQPINNLKKKKIKVQTFGKDTNKSKLHARKNYEQIKSRGNPATVFSIISGFSRWLSKT